MSTDPEYIDNPLPRNVEEEAYAVAEKRFAATPNVELAMRVDMLGEGRRGSAAERKALLAEVARRLRWDGVR